jgi:hypothetical protein
VYSRTKEKVAEDLKALTGACAGLSHAKEKRMRIELGPFLDH